MRLSNKHRLAILLHTAAMWHSDKQGGINLLSLSSTRKVHSELHRDGLVQEIKADIFYCLDRPDVDDAMKDLKQLADLMAKVKTATVGKEWLSDKDNLRLNEELFQAGKL